MKELRVEVGKKIPKKEMDNRCIFMTSHMTLSSVSYRLITLPTLSFQSVCQALSPVFQLFIGPTLNSSQYVKYCNIRE